MLVLFGSVLMLAGMFGLMFGARCGRMFLSGLAAVIYARFNVEGLVMTGLGLSMVLIPFMKMELLAFLEDFLRVAEEKDE